MRRCNIPPPSCRHKYSTPCCRDCREADCPARCENDPARCYCWSDRPPAKAKERRPKLDRAEILRLHNKGLLQREIAALLGYSTSGVSAVLRELAPPQSRPLDLRGAEEETQRVALSPQTEAEQSGVSSDEGVSGGG